MVARSELSPAHSRRGSSTGGLTMRVSPRSFLACTLAGSVAVTVSPFLTGRAVPPPAAGDAVDQTVEPSWPDVVQRRLLAKDLIAREAAAGKWSLVEAAALFGELNRLPPEGAERAFA